MWNEEGSFIEKLLFLEVLFVLVTVLPEPLVVTSVVVPRVFTVLVVVPLVVVVVEVLVLPEFLLVPKPGCVICIRFLLPVRENLL